MSITVCGTVAFDSIETPFGKTDKDLGGSANYFSLSASYFTKVNCVSVVGQDFPKEHLELMRSKGIDTSGIDIKEGKSFFWAGQYGYDLNNAKTLQTSLNVLETFEPKIPENYKSSPVLFLANLKPQIQESVLSEMYNPRITALDTMNYWIEGENAALLQVISKVNILLINEAELRQLTKTYNIIDAATLIRKMGPQILVVKRGEYGAMLFDHGDVFCIPAMPLAVVMDPTGAGDSFAGGFMGYLASQHDYSISRNVLRKAIVYGCVMASFTVQDFGVKKLLQLDNGKIEERFHKFLAMTNL